jgi:hypothetical protein
MNKCKVYLTLLLVACDIQASPLSVVDGGTATTSFTAYSVVCGGTTTTGAFQNVSGLGSSGNGLLSAGAAALPTWGNVFPGYIAGTGFGFAGTTSTLAASPDHTLIISTTTPASITSSATDNTAFGYNALNAVTSNVQCTAVGSSALELATGDRNTAVGYQAGKSITTGTDNVAFGSTTLSSNSTGNYNVAFGTRSCVSSTVSGLTAFGYQTLNANTTGTNNTAFGYQAGRLIQDGGNNTAFGLTGMQANVSGTDNTCLGYQSLNACTGSQSVGIGSGAGATATSGSNNIYIGYNSTPISASESNNIVIGNSSSATAYIFGVTGATSSSGSNVLINTSSALGTTTSAQRFKFAIRNVTFEKSSQLLRLNVVKFNYIDDETNEINYGMIAEEVVDIFPETIVYDLSGQIQTIQYHKFIPLVIKQVQEQTDDIAYLKLQIKSLTDTVAKLSKLVS